MSLKKKLALALAGLVMAAMLMKPMMGHKPALHAGGCYLIQMPMKDGSKLPSALLIKEVKDGKYQGMLILGMQMPMEVKDCPVAELDKDLKMLEPVEVNCQTGQPLK